MNVDYKWVVLQPRVKRNIEWSLSLCILNCLHHKSFLVHFIQILHLKEKGLHDGSLLIDWSVDCLEDLKTGDQTGHRQTRLYLLNMIHHLLRDHSLRLNVPLSLIPLDLMCVLVQVHCKTALIV
jgi:hypothetical protein